LPCNWLVGALVIEYARNLRVGVYDGVSQNQLEGWSTSCTTSVHRNCIMPHQVGVALQANV